VWASVRGPAVPAPKIALEGTAPGVCSPWEAGQMVRAPCVRLGYAELTLIGPPHPHTKSGAPSASLRVQASQLGGDKRQDPLKAS
jgi:hypothetical protein